MLLALNNRFKYAFKDFVKYDREENDPKFNRNKKEKRLSRKIMYIMSSCIAFLGGVKPAKEVFRLANEDYHNRDGVTYKFNIH